MPLRLDMEIRDYLAIILKKKWVIIFSFLMVITAAFWYIALTPEKYKSKTTILVIPQHIPEAYARGGSTPWIENRLGTLHQLITSRSRLTQVINEYGLNKGSRTSADEEAAAAKIRERIEVNIIRRDSFTVSFYHEDPMIAMLVTKKLASFFMEENLKGYDEQASQTEDFLQKRLIETKQILEEKEGKIRQYRFKYLEELPQQVPGNLSRINQLESEKKRIYEMIRDKEEKRAQLSTREQTLNKSMYSIFKDNNVVDSNNPEATVPAALQPVSDLEAKRAKLEELLARYTENHPEVLRMREELNRLEKSSERDGKQAIRSNRVGEGKPNRSFATFMKLISPDPEEKLLIKSEISKVDKDLTNLNNRLQETQEAIEKYQAMIIRAPKHEQELMYLTRETDQIRSAYNDLAGKTLSLDMSQAMNKRREGDHFQVLDPANLPKAPFSPNVKKILQLAFIAGLGLGIVLVFGLEILNTKISGIKDFKHYSDLPVLAAFPVIEKMEFHEKKSWIKYVITGGLASFAISFAMLILLHAPKMKKIIYSLGALL